MSESRSAAILAAVVAASAATFNHDCVNLGKMHSGLSFGASWKLALHRDYLFGHPLFYLFRSNLPKLSPRGFRNLIDRRQYELSNPLKIGIFPL